MMRNKRKELLKWIDSDDVKIKIYMYMHSIMIYYNIIINNIYDTQYKKYKILSALF